MIERLRQGKLIWINLKKPTQDEVQKVMHELDISPALMTDLTSVVPKNAVTVAEDVIKLTLDFPAIRHIEADRQFEVKFFILKKGLLTVQYEEMEGFDRFKKQFEVAATLHKFKRDVTGAHLFFSLFGNLYDSAHSKLDYIESQLSEIESDIFTDNEKHMVYEISNISKKLISFRHTIQSHEDIFYSLTLTFEDMYGDTFDRDLQNIRTQFFSLQHKANTQFETLVALRDTNSAMLTTKQNEVIKLFTIIAFITFPLTLFSSMFGMNVVSAPIIGQKHDFWIILGIMCTVAMVFFAYFKHKRWM